MGGVDLFDQLIKYYSFARKGLKWTRKYVLYLIQMDILNAYALYSKYHPDVKGIKLLDFLDCTLEYLLYFKGHEWLASGPALPNAPDLPVGERFDVLPPGPDESTDEYIDVDDPLPVEEQPPIVTQAVRLAAAHAAAAAALAVPVGADAVPVAAEADWEDPPSPSAVPLPPSPAFTPPPPSYPPAVAAPSSPPPPPAVAGHSSAPHHAVASTSAPH